MRLACDLLVLHDEPLIRELLAEAVVGEDFVVCEAETVGPLMEVPRAHGARLLVVYISGRWEALRDLAPTPRERVLPKSFTGSGLVALARGLIGNQAPSPLVSCHGR